MDSKLARDIDGCCSLSLQPRTKSFRILAFVRLEGHSSGREWNTRGSRGSQRWQGAEKCVRITKIGTNGEVLRDDGFAAIAGRVEDSQQLLPEQVLDNSDS